MSLRNIILLAVIAVVSVIAATLLWRPLFKPGEILVTDAHVHGAIADIGVLFDSSVRELNVRVGDRVAAGDVVARLASAHLFARVQERRAEAERRNAEREATEVAVRLDNERNRLSRDQAGQEVQAARAALQAARASAALARRAFARDEQLLADGIIPRARLDNSREQLQTAEADVREAQARLESARAGTGLATVELNRIDVLEAELQARTQERAAAEAELAIAEADLAAAIVTAPHDGLVVAVHAREGASVRPNDPIASIWLADNAWINAWVSEDSIAELRPGDIALIDLPAIGIEGQKATLSSILVAPDGLPSTLPGQPVSPLLPDRPRFAVRLELPDAAWRSEVLPGMSARVLFTTD